MEFSPFCRHSRTNDAFGSSGQIIYSVNNEAWKNLLSHAAEGNAYEHLSFSAFNDFKTDASRTLGSLDEQNFSSTCCSYNSSLSNVDSSTCALSNWAWQTQFCNLKHNQFHEGSGCFDARCCSAVSGVVREDASCSIENSNLLDSCSSSCGLASSEIKNLTTSNYTAENNGYVSQLTSNYNVSSESLTPASSNISFNRNGESHINSMFTTDALGLSVPKISAVQSTNSPCSYATDPATSEGNEMIWKYNQLMWNSNSHYVDVNSDFPQAKDEEARSDLSSSCTLQQSDFGFDFDVMTQPEIQCPYDNFSCYNCLSTPARDDVEKRSTRSLIKPTKITIATLVGVMPLIIQQYPLHSKLDLCRFLKGRLYENSPKPSPHFLHNTLIPVFLAAVSLEFPWQLPKSHHSLCDLKSWICEQPGGRTLLNKIKIQSHVVPADAFASGSFKRKINGTSTYYGYNKNEYFDYCLNVFEYWDEAF